jgi:hypothetical protein
MRGDLLVTAQGTPNNTVNVAAGLGYVPQGQSALGSAYAFPNDGTVVLTVPAAHATLPRRDLIVARVRDAFYTGSQNQGSIELITGTAASTPADPTLPADSSYLVLARIAVPANGSGTVAVANANITNLAVPVQLVNAITPIDAADNIPGLYNGQYRDHPTLGLQRWNGTQWDDPNPWQSYPVQWLAAGGNPTLGNGTLQGRYRRQGRTVTFSVYLKHGSSTLGGIGSYAFTLPVPADVASSREQFVLAKALTNVGNVQGLGSILETTLVGPGLTVMPMFPTNPGGGNSILNNASNTTPNGAGPGVPGPGNYPWSAGHNMWVGGTYEAAAGA